MDRTPDHVLVPLEIERFAAEPLAVLNRLEGRPNLAVTLLHVVNLSVVTSENRLYHELAESARRALETISRDHLSPSLDVRVKIRLGKPLPEIRAEVREVNACLIILPVFPVPRWRRLFAAFTPTVAEKLARNAPCPVFVLRAGSPSNHRDRWTCGPAEPVPADPRSWERFRPIMASSPA